MTVTAPSHPSSMASNGRGAAIKVNPIARVKNEMEILPIISPDLIIEYAIKRYWVHIRGVTSARSGFLSFPFPIRDPDRDEALLVPIQYGPQYLGLRLLTEDDVPGQFSETGAAVAEGGGHLGPSLRYR
ncbi:hypothetical protein DSECCO2_651820 [anaerobic digester metagenome]